MRVHFYSTAGGDWTVATITGVVVSEDGVDLLLGFGGQLDVGSKVDSGARGDN